MTRTGTALFTGGTGYLGQHFRARLDRAGWNTSTIGRSQPGTHHWQLGDTPDPSVFYDVDTIVHAAYDTLLTAPAQIRWYNIEGTRKLLDGAANAGVKNFILISSIAAHENACSHYGRAKLECEAIASRHGAIVIRPGMVYGENSGGVYGAIDNWVQSLPVIPLLWPSPRLYTCHVDDLSALVLETLRAADRSPTLITAACRDPVSLGDIVNHLQNLHATSKPVLPVPWRMPWLACKSLELLGLAPPFRSDGLVGLMQGNPSPDFSALNYLDTSFRHFTLSRVDQ